jgi:hypothetical protein
MNSIKKGSSSEGLSEKKAYEPPKAMRLGDMRNGAGQSSCFGGSGDGSGCFASGNLASGSCSDSGDTVV